MLVFWNRVVGWILHGISKLSSTISESPGRRPERESKASRDTLRYSLCMHPLVAGVFDSFFLFSQTSHKPLAAITSRRRSFEEAVATTTTLSFPAIADKTRPRGYVPSFSPSSALPFPSPFTPIPPSPWPPPWTSLGGRSPRCPLGLAVTRLAPYLHLQLSTSFPSSNLHLLSTTQQLQPRRQMSLQTVIAPYHQFRRRPCLLSFLPPVPLVTRNPSTATPT